MTFMELIDSLFRHGLGELPVFYTRLRGMYLGNMVYVKGRIFFKDKGFLHDIEAPSEQPDWERHMLGMVCYRTLLQWESLTFYGLDHCRLNEPADPGHADTLKQVVNDQGERLYDYVGSIYRACHLMLDNGFLPVVLLQPILSKDSVTGLAIADLRALLPGGDKHDEIAGVIRNAVRNQTTLNVESLGPDEID